MRSQNELTHPSHSKSTGPSEWPSNITEAVRAVLRIPCLTPIAPEFKFSMSKEAAQHNFCVLSKYNKDLGRALDAQNLSPLGYGSEFRATTSLKIVFGLHPNWKRTESILLNGSDWPMEDLDSKSRSEDMKEALEFGNYKGATEKPELLRKLIEKDISHGYGLVLPLAKIHRIPNILLAPMNVMNQNTIDECGKIIGKDRLTHDQSYKWGSGNSAGA